MNPESVALHYRGVNIPAGGTSVFEQKTRRGGHRWDGLMLDVIYREAGIQTVSFASYSNALTVLTQAGRVRKPRRLAKPGDVVFLAADEYVGIVLAVPDKHTLRIMVGWWPNKTSRTVRVFEVHRTLDVLAVADPRLPISTTDTRVPTNTGAEIAAALQSHPGVGTFVPPRLIASAYARWQRYCGYGPDKVTGRPDTFSLDRLSKESGR